MKNNDFILDHRTMMVKYQLYIRQVITIWLKTQSTKMEFIKFHLKIEQNFLYRAHTQLCMKAF